MNNPIEIPQDPNTLNFMEQSQYAQKLAESMMMWASHHSPTTGGKLLQAFRYWYPKWSIIIETLLDELVGQGDLPTTEGPSRGRRGRVRYISV